MKWKMRLLKQDQDYILHDEVPLAELVEAVAVSLRRRRLAGSLRTAGFFKNEDPRWRDKRLRLLMLVQSERCYPFIEGAAGCTLAGLVQELTQLRTARVLAVKEALTSAEVTEAHTLVWKCGRESI